MKYINADKLLNKLLKETDLSKSYLIRVIDELSEERENTEISLKEEEKEPNCDLINNEIQKRLKERFGGLQYDLEKRVEAIEQKLKKLSE